MMAALTKGRFLFDVVGKTRTRK